jgi:hypothetical protein
MADRRARAIGLAVLGIVAAMTVGAGCGDSSGSEAAATTDAAPTSTSTPTPGGRPRAAEEPRDDEIRSTIDAVWQAAGVDAEAVYVGRYAYTFAPDNITCAALERDDRWFGERGSSVGPGVIDQAAAEATITGYLEDEGFAVELFRSTHPASLVRTYRGVRDEVVVFGFLNRDGATDVNVRSGPCAPAFSTFDPELYQPDS